MKVKELIEILQKEDQDATVVVHDGAGGYSTVEDVMETYLSKEVEDTLDGDEIEEEISVISIG